MWKIHDFGGILQEQSFKKFIFYFDGLNGKTARRQDDFAINNARP